MASRPRIRRDLPSEIRKDREAARRQVNTSPFFNTGIHPTGNGGMESDSFDGDLDAGNAGTTGWAFNDSKVAVGELILRPGSIGNDTLAEPVRAARLHDDAQNFAVSTGSGAQILSASVAVPAGYSQALVLNIAVAVTAFNNTAGSDFLYAFGLVNGASAGWQIGSADVPASKTGVAYDLSSAHLTGLSGGTLTVTGFVSSAFGAWAANTSNVANLDAAVLFLR